MPAPPPPPVPSPAPTTERRRAAYAAELALGTDRFHEPRREDCPWCGAHALRIRLTTPDLVQRKPGRFTLAECRACGHTFQNPRLTPEGLSFYHWDRRDRCDHWDAGATHGTRPAPAPSRRRLRDTARAMLPYGEPESWLDVGTGAADFPDAARALFPYTAFDGLDPTPRVVRARDAGRVEEAHIGRLTAPATAARLRARYDVVSLLHHLEHTPDPRAELRAALDALRPGGHLLLEVADPRSLSGALLGRWWLPHTQPHHLHLLPAANLRAELESQGCDVLSTDRHGPHTPHDLAAATSLFLTRALPSPDAPWRPVPPSGAEARTRRILTRAARPLLATARAADLALAPVARRTRFSNTYRLIARKDRGLQDY
ncbi:class I SAM-dependent methyltransferase [Streptomyces sp. NPDC091377]|uniref:class I SAM-dependent methyltransferase n=1 Tax=Streptomyces sp. NPDC091377 TaxID=3365995 RepID=UPI0037F6B5FF